MSRFMLGALSCLLVAGLEAPAAAQGQDAQALARVAQYYRASPAEANWPEEVLCGAEFTVDVTMTNPANPKWTEEDFHKLGPVKGEDEMFRPDGQKFKLPDGVEVPFRGQHTFTLELTAPDEPGTYETLWSMMRQGAAYGEQIKKSIRVYCDDAELGRALFPEMVACGDDFTVEVRMKNNGASTWTETGFYKLGPVKKEAEVFRPDGHKFKMPDLTEVAPGERYVFQLELTAPEKAGTYETHWTMMDSGRPFGEQISRTIEVECESESRDMKSGRE